MEHVVHTEFNESTQNCTQNFKFISELSGKERQEFLDSFDVIFSDCDGVIWQSLCDFIPGVAEAIDYLKRQGKQVRYVTNNSIIPIEKQLSKFRSSGLNVERYDIVHPAQSVCDHLKSIEFDGLIYAITSNAFKEILQEAGFQLAKEGNCFVGSIEELREAVFSDEPVKAVIVDVDFNLTAAKLMRAHAHLKKDPTCLFIGGASDGLIPFCGRDVIGPGPFITVLECTTKRKALILGKPGMALRDKLLKEHQLLNPKRAIFIGDSLTTDMTFANMCGFQTLLVLSGGTKLEDLQTPLKATEMPDYVVDCLSSLNGLV